MTEKIQRSEEVSRQIFKDIVYELTEDEYTEGTLERLGFTPYECNIAMITIRWFMDTIRDTIREDSPNEIEDVEKAAAVYGFCIGAAFMQKAMAQSD